MSLRARNSNAKHAVWPCVILLKYVKISQDAITVVNGFYSATTDMGSFSVMKSNTFPNCNVSITPAVRLMNKYTVGVYQMDNSVRNTLCTGSIAGVSM